MWCDNNKQVREKRQVQARTVQIPHHQHANTKHPTIPEQE
jgi:hypothetical protein